MNETASRTEVVAATMREMSRQSDPEAALRVYARRMQAIAPVSRLVSVTRRGVEPPGYLIARSSVWGSRTAPAPDPPGRPRLEGGLLGELAYGEEPRLLPDFHPEADDPAFEHLAGARSLVSIPVFDGGVALNTTMFLDDRPHAFDAERVAEMVLTTNLLGRMVHNLALAEDLRRTNALLDAELESVARIQRMLLPADLPAVPGLELAAAYRTPRRAGGDYYDVFDLEDGRHGLLVADVSGHGTPAAVLMAILHTLAHSYAGPPAPPGSRLAHLNRHLARRYTAESGAFATIFYGVWDPEARRLVYARAGHNPPRLFRAASGETAALDGAPALPAGVLEDQRFPEASVTLEPGDRLLLYTDGITEARDPTGAFYGTAPLDRLLAATPDPRTLVTAVLADADRFSHPRPLHDDQTLLACRVLPAD